MAKTNKLILNSIKCPDGAILTSRSVHDYKTHGPCMVDGGLCYIRRTVTEYEELSQYYDDEDHEHNRKYFEWGTYGKEGNKVLAYVKLTNMSTNHIQAVLDDGIVGGHIEDIMKKELEYRYER